MSIGPGWRRLVYVLSIVPTVDWVLLGSGASEEGQGIGSLHTCPSSADAPCQLEGKACNNDENDCADAASEHDGFATESGSGAAADGLAAGAPHRRFARNALPSRTLRPPIAVLP